MVAPIVDRRTILRGIFTLPLSAASVALRPSTSVAYTRGSKKIFKRTNKQVLRALRRYQKSRSLSFRLGRVIPWPRDGNLYDFTVRMPSTGFSIISDISSRSFVHGKRRRTRRRKVVTGTGYHSGIDSSAPIGVPILAPYDGWIDAVKYKFSTGFTVSVAVDVFQDGYKKSDPEYIRNEFKERLAFVFGHVGFIYVRVGERVKRGQVICENNATGFGTTDSIPHVHTEVYLDGTREIPHFYWYGAPADLQERSYGNKKVEDVVNIPHYRPGLKFDPSPGSRQIATYMLPLVEDVSHFLRIKGKLKPVRYG